MKLKSKEGTARGLVLHRQKQSCRVLKPNWIAVWWPTESHPSPLYQLMIPRAALTSFGRRSFAVTVTAAWNSLWQLVRAATHFLSLNYQTSTPKKLNCFISHMLAVRHGFSF